MTTAEKKESFRKYLETSGVIDALTKSKYLEVRKRSFSERLCVKPSARGRCLRAKGLFASYVAFYSQISILYMTHTCVNLTMYWCWVLSSEFYVGGLCLGSLG